MKFVITGLPRSRTAWFSAYLTNGDVLCYHEAIHYGYKLEGRPIVGTADSSYLMYPQRVEEIGEHKLVIIHRNYAEVEKSVAAIGYPDLEGLLPSMAEDLGSLNGLHIGYNDIDDRLEEIHEYLDIPYDRLRAELFINMNIQAFEWST